MAAAIDALSAAAAAVSDTGVGVGGVGSGGGGSNSGASAAASLRRVRRWLGRLEERMLVDPDFKPTADRNFLRLRQAMYSRPSAAAAAAQRGGGQGDMSDDEQRA